MREAIDAYIEAGGRVARFAGNFAWQVRLEAEGAVQVCYNRLARSHDPEPVHRGRPGCARPDLRGRAEMDVRRGSWRVLIAIVVLLTMLGAAIVHAGPPQIRRNSAWILPWGSPVRWWWAATRLLSCRRRAIRRSPAVSTGGGTGAPGAVALAA